MTARRGDLPSRFRRVGITAKPITILEAYFWDADKLEGCARHNRYLNVPGFAPVLVTRDPGIIRAIATDTGDKPGQFDRDTMPSKGIARATGPDTLLYANGRRWRKQRKIAASPFGKTTLFQPEKFEAFAETFRGTVRSRLEVLRQYLADSGGRSVDLQLEPEIKAVMLEMLANNFFGANISYADLTGRFVPALERLIERIVSDTVNNRLGIPWWRFPPISKGIAEAKQDFQTFEELTDLVLAPRKENRAFMATIQIGSKRPGFT